MAGIGGVFRDSNGRFLQAFSAPVDYTTNNVAELWALRSGLQIALQSSYHHLVIESDSLQTLMDIHRRHTNKWRNRQLLVGCLPLLSSFHTARFLFGYREVNQVADLLAKMGASVFRYFHVFWEIPSFLSVVLLRDLSDTSFCRSIS